MFKLSRATRLLAAAALVAAAPLAQAQATFNTSNNYLTLPVVQLGNVTYFDVVVRLDAFGLISVNGQVGGLAPACPAENMSFTRYGLISVGQTKTQVSQLMGCTPNGTISLQPTYSIYSWSSSSGSVINVYFDQAGTLVVDPGGQGNFKSSQYLIP